MTSPNPDWRPEFMAADGALVVTVDLAAIPAPPPEGIEIHTYVGFEFKNAMMELSLERRKVVLTAIVVEILLVVQNSLQIEPPSFTKSRFLRRLALLVLRKMGFLPNEYLK
jgi:hypothetical protein